MPVRLELTQTNRVLNRGAARSGAPVKVGPVTFTIQPVARRQLMGQSGLVGAASRRAATAVVRYAKASINRAPPRVDTGFMRDSIHADFRGSNQFQTRFRVSSRAEYAIYQHEGTKNPDGSWRIYPRKFLTNALKRLRTSDWAP